MSRPVTDWHSTCLRCARPAALGEHPTGCASCALDGIGVPLIPTAVRRTGVDRAKLGGTGTMWDWADLLPPVGAPVSLGEGGTPLVDLDWTGVPGRVLVKDERANPTGSFKDRLCSAAVTRARSVGAEVVALASSGNAAVSAAAYAAAAGLRCVALTTPGLAEPTAAALHLLGARLLLTATAADRWRALRTGVNELGWYPLTNYVAPPVASNVFGVLAYRTIAFEIARTLDWRTPDWVVVPVSRGDGLYGVWSGFVELAERGWTTSVPRMLAVERFPSLSRALAGGNDQPEAVDADEPVAARSIGDRQASFMGATTLRRSGGRAYACGDEPMRWAAREFARHGHLYELSSASVLCGLAELSRCGLLSASSTVVLLGTAGPFAQSTLEPSPAGHLVTDPTSTRQLAARASRRPSPVRP